MKYILKHWKTTLAGILVGILTAMLWLEKLDVNEWATGLGVVATAIGIIARDWDQAK